MELQDQIDSFQKLVFFHFHQGANNEYKITPPVHGSIGLSPACHSSKTEGRGMQAGY